MIMHGPQCSSGSQGGACRNVIPFHVPCGSWGSYVGHQVPLSAELYDRPFGNPPKLMDKRVGVAHGIISAHVYFHLSCRVRDMLTDEITKTAAK